MRSTLDSFRGGRVEFWVTEEQIVVVNQTMKKYEESHTTAYLQQCNEEKEGIGCPPELGVEEPGKEGIDAAEGGREQTRSKTASLDGEHAGDGRCVMRKGCLGIASLKQDLTTRAHLVGNEERHRVTAQAGYSGTDSPGTTQAAGARCDITGMAWISLV
ncbi:hypothetical protein EYF80_016715 [Liparis tanakae]|uniref:Uncharacterized protein n=1 Tax=Liparis tanakae TaxID=230148 RepID=A0A4Z2I6F7_9TELE|nr:hypothetical protein EYF80_016715 [Liparis tanakae]